MRIFFSLCNTELLQAVLCKILTESINDLLFLECNILVGNRLVIVLKTYIGKRHITICPLKMLYALCIRSLTGLCYYILISKAERLGDLSCTVRAEIEEDHGIIRLYNA